MDLQQQAQIVAGIRDKMKGSIGERVYIKVNLGRSRINQNFATIIAAHPSVFIAKLEYKRGRTAEQSFQYADILTGVVEVLVDDVPMFGPFDIQPDAPLVDNANKPKVKKRLRPVKPFEQRIRLSSAQVAMLAERLKKEAEENRTNPNHESIISDLSHKYDIMKKAEKTRATWKNDDNDFSGSDSDGISQVDDDGFGESRGVAAVAAANDVVGAIPAPGRKISKFVDSEALQNLVLSGEYDAEVRVSGDSVVAKESFKISAKEMFDDKKSAGKDASKKISKKSAAKEDEKTTAEKTTAEKSADMKAGVKSSAKKKVVSKDVNTSADKNAAAKSSAKNSTKKTAVSKSVKTKKDATKRGTAKNSSAKEVSVDKSTAKITVEKKSSVKQQSAKKGSSKKAAVKKLSTKKTATKKAAVKKTSAKKTATKKAAVKKTSAKKTATKKAAVYKTDSKDSTAKK